MGTILFVGALFLSAHAYTPQAWATYSDHPDPQTEDEGAQEGDDPGCGGCEGETDGSQKRSGVCDDPETTEDPVLLADGAVLESAVDLELPGTTFGFRLSRNYNSFYPTSAVNSASLLAEPIGAKWKMGLGGAVLRQGDNGSLVWGRTTSSKRTFAYDDGTEWTPPGDLSATLKKGSISYDIDGDMDDETVEVYVIKMVGPGQGNQYTFWGFESQIPAEMRGRIYEKTDRYGNEKLTYQYDLTTGRIDTIISTQGWSVELDYRTANPHRLENVYAYDGDSNLLAHVTYFYVESVENTSPDLGEHGDLIAVRVKKANSNGGMTIEEWTQYRYEKDLTGLSGHLLKASGTIPTYYYWSSERDTDYYPENDSHYLKAVYDNAALERIVEAKGLYTGGNPDPKKVLELDDNDTTGSTPTTQSFARKWFTYYKDATGGVTSNVTEATWGSPSGGENMENTYLTSDREELPFPYELWSHPAFTQESGGVFRVKSESINGDCGSCSANPIEGGIKRTYHYMQIAQSSPVTADMVRIVTVEDTQDGTGAWMYRKIWGINKDRLTLRRAKLVDEGGTIKYWCESFLRGTNGRTVEHRTYSVHSDIDSQGKFRKFLNPTGNSGANDTETAYANDGLVYIYGHNTNGYITEWKVKKGISVSNPEYFIQAIDYGEDEDTDHATNDEPQYLPIKQWAYPTKTTSKTAGVLTEYEYDFHDPDYDTQLKVRITKLPVVDSTQNGPGSAGRVEIKEYFDDRGRLRWMKDGEGYVTYYSYHPDTGRLAYKLQDVDTGSLKSEIISGSTSTEPKFVPLSDGTGSSSVPTGFTTANAAPLQIETIWEYDTQGREIQQIDPNGAKHFTLYFKDETIHFPYFDGTNVLMPIRITRTNGAGDVTEEIELDPAKATITSGRPTGLAGYTRPDFVSYTRTTYHEYNGQKLHTDRYFKMVGGGNTVGTHLYRTSYAYDTRGRLTHLVENVSGDESTTGKWQITQTSYDAMDRPVRIRRTVTSGVPADLEDPDPAYKLISQSLYDGATTWNNAAVGNGYLTLIKNYYSTDLLFTGTRIHRTYRGHARGLEPVYGDDTPPTPSISTADGPYDVVDVDWQGRVIAAAQYKVVPTWATVLQSDGYTAYADNASYDANRGSLARGSYDDMGRIYRIEKAAVNSSTGAADYVLRLDSYYDRTSRLVGVAMAGQGGVEYAYDGVGRPYQLRRVTALEATPYTSGAYNYRSPLPVPGVDAANNKTYMTGGNDQVINLDHSEFDVAGNAIRSIHWAAYHNDTNGLDAEATTKDYVQTSIYAWFDKANRITASADYGTNDAEFTAAALPTRDSTAPSSTDTRLVTTFAYDVTGRSQTTTDPTSTGVDTVTIWDALGRTTRVREAAGETEERGTLAVYDGLSNAVKLIADLDNNGAEDSTDQVTGYTYGDLSNAYLLTLTEYPDSQGTSDAVAFDYHLDGTPDTRTDQRGAVITFDYDNRRRITGQDLTTMGTADASTGKIAYTYDGLGRRKHVTSYDNAGTPAVINDILYAYTDYGALATEYQAHGGTVSTTTSPRVDYVYDESYVYDASSQRNVFTKALRLTDIVYPASTGTDLADLTKRRNIKFNYAAGIADGIGRTSEIRDDADTDLASYSYLGDGTVVAVNYDQPELTLDYIQDTTAPYAYKGFDRFGRVVDHRWDDLNAAGDINRFKHGYDRNSNRTYTWNTETSGQDSLYAYDKLNRLIQFGRGTLTGTFDGFDIPPDETFRQTWGLDGLGNWESFKEHEYIGGASPTLTLDQTRAHNKVNEIDTDDNHVNGGGASIGIDTTGTNWFDPTYDAAGNMTAFPKPSDPANGYTAVYDAWNRLVEIKAGSNTVAKYEYDGVGRRIVKDVHVSGSHDHYQHYYYTVGWQVIEERINSGTLADCQFVWGLRYADELILRDRNAAASGNLGVTGSGLDERIFCIQDANFNVTAITDDEGDVLERYRYTPYGERTIFNVSYAVRSTSSYDWEVGHQGLVHDAETGLIQNRNRYLHKLLGRFTQRDYLGYIDGMSTYQYVRINPLKYNDYNGLISTMYDPRAAALVAEIGGGSKLGFEAAAAGGLALGTAMVPARRPPVQPGRGQPNPRGPESRPKPIPKPYVDPGKPPLPNDRRPLDLGRPDPNLPNPRPWQSEKGLLAALMAALAQQIDACSKWPDPSNPPNACPNSTPEIGPADLPPTGKPGQIIEDCNGKMVGYYDKDGNFVPN